MDVEVLDGSIAVYRGAMADNAIDGAGEMLAVGVRAEGCCVAVTPAAFIRLADNCSPAVRPVGNRPSS